MGNLCSTYTEEKIPPIRRSKTLIPRLHSREPLDLSCFSIQKVLGSGSFGKVFLVTKKDTNKQYAMKAINKSSLNSSNKKIQALTERELLAQVNSPFVVKLHFAFQNQQKLFLVLDFLEGGELFGHLKRMQRFPEYVARFYAAEVLLALQDLHKRDIIYRDLKPENILLDRNGHVKLADFNLAKAMEGKRQLTSTMCGTPEYIAPEVLKGWPQGKQVDFWGFGVLLFEMLDGRSPFRSNSCEDIFQKILKNDYKFSNCVGESAQKLISRLLDPSPKTRLSSLKAVMEHEFFEGVNWELTRVKLSEAPFCNSEIEGLNSWSRIDLSPAAGDSNSAFTNFSFTESIEDPN